MNNRPSNTLIYVVVSITGLIGIYILGLFFESGNWRPEEQGRQPDALILSQDQY